MTSRTLASAHTADRDLEHARREYQALVERGQRLDLTRGKPSAAQLALSAELLELPGNGPDGQGRYTAADGTDCRNYGGQYGLPELREIFAGPLQVPTAQLVAAGNSSLALMHDCLLHALFSGVPGGSSRWLARERTAFLCPVPGYDRHFAICERFGVEMIPVPMTPHGPDMDTVERLAAEDPAVRGIWCVPKYSNPNGACYSEDTVRRLARMRTAADDFRIFWDNAYAVHHLTDQPVELADLLAACTESGHPDRALIFGSTSKITFAGAGVAFFGASPDNVDWLLRLDAERSIGPDKVNQLRHALFLRDAEGLSSHMAQHRRLLEPKFQTVARVLDEELGGLGLANWTRPAGGYFVTLEVPEGCAREVVRLAGEAGIALTPAGYTHPYGRDPQDATIRIAPSCPDVAELEQAMRGLACCVRLAAGGQQPAPAH